MKMYEVDLLDRKSKGRELKHQRVRCWVDDDNYIEIALATLGGIVVTTRGADGHRIEVWPSAANQIQVRSRPWGLEFDAAKEAGR